MQALYDVPVRNDSGAEIPAFAVMRPRGTINQAGRWVMKVEKPKTNFERLYLFNGPTKIPASGFGNASYGTDPSRPCVVLRASGTATYGDGWGVSHDSWSLTRAYPGGFLMHGDSATTKGLFSQAVVTTVYGSLDEALKYHMTAKVSVLGFESSTSYPDSGLDIDAACDGFLKSGRQIASGGNVEITWLGTKWVVTNSRECSGKIPE